MVPHDVENEGEGPPPLPLPLPLFAAEALATRSYKFKKEQLHRFVSLYVANIKIYSMRQQREHQRQSVHNGDSENRIEKELAVCW